jgi:hypothetical protein
VFNLNFYNDANSNLLSISAIHKPRYNQAFSYDELNRLLNANTIYGTFDYTYNYLGTPILMTDDTGEVVWEAD